MNMTLQYKDIRGTGTGAEKHCKNRKWYTPVLCASSHHGVRERDESRTRNEKHIDFRMDSCKAAHLPRNAITADELPVLMLLYLRCWHYLLARHSLSRGPTDRIEIALQNKQYCRITAVILRCCSTAQYLCRGFRRRCQHRLKIIPLQSQAQLRCKTLLCKVLPQLPPQAGEKLWEAYGGGHLRGSFPTSFSEPRPWFIQIVYRLHHLLVSHSPAYCELLHSETLRLENQSWKVAQRHPTLLSIQMFKCRLYAEFDILDIFDIFCMEQLKGAGEEAL